MSEKPPIPPDDSQEEISALVRQLRDTQQRLQELTGGELDAVLFPGGQSYLLQNAQEKLRESEETQRNSATMQSSILNALPAHIALLDHRGVILSVNDRWKNFAGSNALDSSYSGVGQNYLEICEQAQGDCAEEAHAVAAAIRAILSGESNGEFEIEYPCHSPTEQRWFLLRVNPMAKDWPHGAVVVHTDITGRKLAEEALRESEERIRLAAEAAGIAVWAWDLQTGKIRWDQKMFDIYGIPPEPDGWVTYEDWRARVLPEDFAEQDEKLRRTVATCGRGHREFRITRASDNALRFMQAAEMVVTSNDGKAARVVGINLDITERKCAENALRESEERFRLLAKATNDAVWDWDAVTGEVWWNESFEATFGYRRGEIEPGLNGWTSRLHPDDKERVLNRLYKAVATGGTVFSSEYRFLRKDGSYAYILNRSHIICDAEGEPVRMIGSMTDLTERANFERDLARINRALQMLSACNEKLIRTESEQELLDEICRLAVEIGGYRMVWVGYAQEDVERTIKPMAHAGEVAGYFDHIKILWDESKPAGRGPAGRTIREGQPVVCEDLDRDETLSPWTEPAQERGYKAMLCLPLRADGKTFGMLGLYSAEVNRSDENEIKLLQELADDLAFGIGSLRGSEKRRQAEQALRDSESKFSKIFQSSPVAIALSTLEEGRYLDANDAFLKMVQGSRDDVIGHTALELGIWDGMEHRAAEIAKVKEHGAVCNVEMDIRGREGRVTHVLWSADAVDIGGKTYLLGLSRDITDWKRVEARFRRLVDSNAQAVFFWNTKGEISSGNDAFLKIAGYTREELEAGRINWAAMTPLEYNDRDQLAIKELTATGICNPYEKEWIRKDGTRVPILLGAALFEDNREEGVMFVLDLTERKKIEQQFLRAQRMESIGTLAGGIAHDLNNALAPILMSVEILREKLTDQASHDTLAILEDSALHGANLVRQVLTFARGVDGQRIPINPIHLLNEIQNIIRDTFPKNINFSFNHSRDLWTVTGDPTQLHQVFTNLCVNARDAMPEGGSLKVTMENAVLDDVYAGMNPDCKPGTYVVVTVTDTGTGIPPAVRERIFEPFFTTKEIGKGTGLGLSTTIAIVKSHGGFINLYSEMGKGTTFKVYLPADTTQQTVEATAVAQTQFPRGNGELILVVDDEESIRRVALKTLERFGYHVLLAANGAEAVSLYAQQRKKIAVVLTDMAMPIMDGPATIIALKAMNPDVKIIGSSGLAANGGVAKAMDAGVKHFIPKPYTAEAMLKTIAKVIRGQD
jgi:PAS domain S-box-containing protein